MRTLALIALAALMLAGCETTKYVPTSAPFCKAVQTVCISKDDTLTEGTASQVEANNLGHAKVCPTKKIDCSKPQ